MKISIFTIAFSALVLSAQAQVKSFSLVEAQSFAVKNAYDVKDKQLEVKKTKELIREVAASGLPQVNGSLGFTNYLNIPVQVIPNFINDILPIPDPNAPEFISAQFGVNYNANAGISAQQLVFDGSYIVALMATRVAKDLTERDLEKSIIDIQEAVAQAYFGVLTLLETATILEKNLTFLNSSLRETQQLFEAGFLEAQDADQLELLASTLENNLLNARNQLAISRKILNYQMGLDIRESIELTDNINTLMTGLGDGESVLDDRFELTQHVEYRRLQTQERAGLLSKRREQMEYLPKVNVGYTYSQNYFDNNWNPTTNTDQWFPTQFYNVGVQVPIFSGFRRSARVAQARLDMARLDIAREQVSDALQMEYEQARATYLYNLANYRTQERNAALATKIRDRSAIKFKEGIDSSLDLTQAQNQLLDTQRALLQAGADVLSARIRLEKVLGKYNR
jgi:outer membrane protein